MRLERSIYFRFNTVSFPGLAIFGRIDVEFRTFPARNASRVAWMQHLQE
jgi:hypothetical protein